MKEVDESSKAQKNQKKKQKFLEPTKRENKQKDGNLSQYL